jgi:hypothetical protein
MYKNKIDVTIDHIKLRKEIKYESWKYKNKDHIDCIFFIFKRWFMDILDLSENDWHKPETKEMFCKYIYKRKGI